MSSDKVKRFIISNKELFLVEDVVTEHINKYFSQLVKMLPYSKSQYSNFDTEERRFVFSVNHKMTAEDYVSMIKTMQIQPILNGNIVHEAISSLFNHMTKFTEQIFDVGLKNTSMYVNYADIQTTHTQHTDYGYEYSAIYYPVTEWSAEDAGETIFVDDNGDIAYSVLPKPRRAVFFDSNIPHIGRCPSPLNRRNRYTIAFKFQVTKLRSEEREEPIVQRVDKPKDESSKDIK